MQPLESERLPLEREQQPLEKERWLLERECEYGWGSPALYPVKAREGGGQNEPCASPYPCLPVKAGAGALTDPQLWVDPFKKNADRRLSNTQTNTSEHPPNVKTDTLWTLAVVPPHLLNKIKLCFCLK